MNDKKELWFDLKIGDEIKPGDRCFGNDEKWFELTEENLSFLNVVDKCSRPIQRKYN